MASGAGVCSRVKEGQTRPSPQVSTAPAIQTAPQIAQQVLPDLNTVLPLVRGFALNKEHAKADLTEFTKLPHPFGSKRQAEIIDWLINRLTDLSFQPVKDSFTATAPNPKVAFGPKAADGATIQVNGANVVVSNTVKADAGCVVALGSHFDTKHIDGLEYVGANDGGSSTIALIQQLAYLKALAGPTPICDIVGIFFDGEEALLPDWYDGETKHPARIRDNTYGSRSIASRLTDCRYNEKAAKCLPATLGGKPLVALVLMDMIGSPQLKITRDALSTPSLRQLTASSVRVLAIDSIYDTRVLPIEDDHIPFLERGVPAVDLIDFENLAFWHREGDLPENVSLESVEQAARLALMMALAIAREPGIVH